jgi:hypothetical protein
MCSAPDPPDVKDVPQRAMAMLPDNGDPTVRMSLRNPRRLTTSAMVFAERSGKLAPPNISAPIGTKGL